MIRYTAALFGGCTAGALVGIGLFYIWLSLQDGTDLPW